jgi:hypothetical protein
LTESVATNFKNYPGIFLKGLGKTRKSSTKISDLQDKFGKWNPPNRRQSMAFSKNGKVIPVHAIKAYRGSSGTAPLILNICTRGR